MMVTPRIVNATFKKAFTCSVTSLQFDPCLSTQQIYESIFPSISQHFPNLEFGEIEIVLTGSYGSEMGQPENAPALQINDTCFKNTPYWKGYDEHYSFYTRPKITQNGDECPVCYTPIANIQRPFICHHGFCQSCISRWIRQNENPTCPTCRAELSPHYQPQPTNYIESINMINNNAGFNYMNGLNEIIQDMINNNNINNLNNNNINNQLAHVPPFNNYYNNYINIAT